MRSRIAYARQGAGRGLKQEKKAGILAKPLVGGYAIEDRLFAEYLAGVDLKQLV